MKEQFVPYEIALKLKELGFDKECLAWFAENKEIQIAPDVYKKWTSKPLTNLNIIKVFNIDCITAPLWQQVIDWLKEKHGIFVFIDMGKYYDSYAEAYPFQAWCKIYKNKELIHSITVRNKLDNENFIFYSYEEAREQAILKAIELIKK